MKGRRIQILLWVLILCLMGAIYGLSGQDAESSNQLSGGVVRKVLALFHPDYQNLPREQQLLLEEECQYLVRKAAHFLEYALLAFLTALSLYPIGKRGGLAAVIFAACFAALDELHQGGIAGRSAQFTDVLIDTAGAAAGAAAALVLLWLIRRAGSRRSGQRERPQCPHRDGR